MKTLAQLVSEARGKMVIFTELPKGSPKACIREIAGFDTEVLPMASDTSDMVGLVLNVPVPIGKGHRIDSFKRANGEATVAIINLHKSDLVAGCTTVLVDDFGGVMPVHIKYFTPE